MASWVLSCSVPWPRQGEVYAVGAQECDLADPGAIRSLVRTVQPDLLVNPAAYTAVDRAERDRLNIITISTVRLLRRLCLRT